MGYEIHGGPQHATLYCNTANTEFGPRFESLSEAEAFVEWLGCNPRRVGDVLDAMLTAFREQPGCYSPFNVDAVYAAMVETAKLPEVDREGAGNWREELICDDCHRRIVHRFKTDDGTCGHEDCAQCADTREQLAESEDEEES